jgi:hypothetical protein
VAVVVADDSLVTVVGLELVVWVAVEMPIAEQVQEVMELQIPVAVVGLELNLRLAVLVVLEL